MCSVWTLLSTIIILLNCHLAYCDNGQSITDEELNTDINLEGSSSKYYDHRQDHSRNLYDIFKDYLMRKNNRNNCNQSLGSFASELSDSDFVDAFRESVKQIDRFIANDQKLMASQPKCLSFSYYLYQAHLHAKHNEFITKNLVDMKCLNRFDSVLNLPSIETREGIWNRNKYCDITSSVSPFIKCDPKSKYRRFDGKCNNLVKTNLGSNFHCNRRLLPPDYSDGVSEPRLASDGTPLPNPRLITTLLMPDIKDYDSMRTSMHMSWGQFMVHDILKTIQYFGLAIDCCSEKHEECLAIDDIPEDELSKAYNQSCISVLRSIACSGCGLGYREQLNAATPVLDLSNLYGGNENNSDYLRSFKKGEMRGDKDQDGYDILPKAILPYDQDTLDTTECSPPADRPWLKCFLNGDGARANQQPMIMAFHTLMRRRHNQHARALSKLNPRWGDEILFQEARRILIAEYTMINFAEYYPKILNKQLMSFYQLNVRQNGFTQYNPNADPTVIQAVLVAALRFGHSQITSKFKVVKKMRAESYGFQLRSKYNEISDIWDGNTNGVIGGLMGTPARAVDPFIVSDVHDHLFFSPNKPQINDLPAMTVNRGRDHGVPGYVYYVQYCTGIKIKSWDDLYQFIPENYVKRLSTVYKNFKDIDLFVGGLAEKHMKDSLVGPTFGCLLAIQIYHWKYGDRFYFEHGGQSGSFTLEQLNNIRETSSLANLLCKTTDFDTIPADPMLISTKTYKISCNKLPEIDYNLWQEDSSCSSYCEALRQNNNLQTLSEN